MKERERERERWEICHVMEEDSISALQSINNQISCDYPSLFHSSQILPRLLLILLPFLFPPVSSFSTLPPSLRSDFDLLSSRKAELLLIKSWHGVYKHGDKPGRKVRDREKRAKARDVSVQGAFHPLFLLTGSWTRSPTVRLSAGAPVTIRTTKNDLPPLSNSCLQIPRSFPLLPRSLLLTASNPFPHFSD